MSLLRRSRGATTDTEQCMALQAASLVLGYPDDALLLQLPLLAAVAQRLPERAGSALCRIVEHLESTDLHAAQCAYVDTFDLRRRCCLFLTYHAYGDTRKRGMALLKFTHAYKAAGWRLVPDELPDHLAVVCEFAATGSLPAGLALLAEHRAGLELTRLALADSGSPWLDAVDLVRAALPEVAPRDRDRAMELARTGPPEEEVGLEPFGPPEQMGAARR